MSKTRREALRSIAAGAAGAALVPLAARAAFTADPAILAVECARAAWAAFGEAVEREIDLERQLPPHFRHSSVCRDEITIVHTDDPRWIAALLEYQAAGAASDRAHLALLDEEHAPTTIAGVVAVLELAADAYDAGEPYGRTFERPNGQQGEDDWRAAVARICAAALARLSAPIS